MLTLYQKRIRVHCSRTNMTSDIPRQVQMYRDGTLKLDELVTASTPRRDHQGYETCTPV